MASNNERPVPKVGDKELQDGQGVSVFSFLGPQTRTALRACQDLCHPTSDIRELVDDLGMIEVEDLGHLRILF